MPAQSWKPTLFAGVHGSLCLNGSIESSVAALSFEGISRVICVRDVLRAYVGHSIVENVLCLFRRSRPSSSRSGRAFRFSPRMPLRPQPPGLEEKCPPAGLPQEDKSSAVIFSACFILAASSAASISGFEPERAAVAAVGSSGAEAAVWPEPSAWVTAACPSAEAAVWAPLTAAAASVVLFGLCFLFQKTTLSHSLLTFLSLYFV